MMIIEQSSNLLEIMALMPLMMGLFGIKIPIVDDIAGAVGLGPSKGEKTAKKAAKAFDNIDLPDLGELPDTEFGRLQTDPRVREQQFDALQKLRDISLGGGLTDEDRARLDQIEREERVAEQGQRDAITQANQRRGVSGSGLAVAQQLKAQQASADRRSARDTQVAGLAQQRALQALRESTNVAGQIDAQQFRRDAATASARDAINAFNRIQRPQQAFQNQLTLQGARSGAQGALANLQERGTDRLTNLIGAGLGAASSFAKGGK